MRVPITALDVCGTGHHLDADVRIGIQLSVPTINRIQLDVHIDHTTDVRQTRYFCFTSCSGS